MCVGGGGDWIPQVGQEQNKEGCSVETELQRDKRGETPQRGSLMPSVDGCFCLVVREQESPKLATALHCEKDKRTLSCQPKFKHYEFNGGIWRERGREGGRGEEGRQQC